jgi:tight adherence protein B
MIHSSATPLTSSGGSTTAAVCGAVVGLGVALILLGWRGVPAGSLGSAAAGWRWRLKGWRARRAGLRLAGAVVAGGLAGAFTGWPAAAGLTGLATWALPNVAGPDRRHAWQVNRIEAVAAWTEMLRDTLSSAAGLQQAIVATTDTAPAAIQPEVRHLRDRLERGQPLSQALRSFAHDLADPTGDLVVVALIQATERQARQLGDLLGALAVSAREQVSMRLRVAAGRARTRTSVRTVVGATAAMAVGLVMLNRGYLEPYDSAGGQVVLCLIGAMFAVGLAWLDRIARLGEAPRVLTAPAPGDEAGRWRA